MPVSDSLTPSSAHLTLREARVKLEQLGARRVDTPEHLFKLRLKLESSFAKYQEIDSKQNQREFNEVLREIAEL